MRGGSLRLNEAVETPNPERLWPLERAASSGEVAEAAGVEPDPTRRSDLYCEAQ
jgi:hypothetical protein